MWESIPCVAGLSVQGMLRAGLSVSLYLERCRCACSSECHLNCGMKDESKINPSVRRGWPGGWLAPLELSCQPCLCLGSSLCSSGLPLWVLPFLGSVRRTPRMKLLHGQSCLLAQGMAVGKLCWQCSRSGVQRGHPQPPCFSLSGAIQIFHSLFGPGIF